MYDIYHCCVHSEKLLMMDQRNCPKHVEFYSKHKSEKLVHLVGFIIRIYHVAHSPERQIEGIDFLDQWNMTFQEISCIVEALCIGLVKSPSVYLRPTHKT